MTSRTFFLSLALSTLLTSSVFAQMVAPGSCSMRPCDCTDLPMMDLFLRAQTENFNAWKDVFSEFFSLSPPSNPTEAVASYASKVSPHPNILSVCPSWSGSSIKLGGLDSSGNAEFDKCFCNSFCDKIVDSVLKHEKRHVLNQVILVTATMPSLITSALIPGSLGKNSTERLRAQMLIESEIDAHHTQVNYLQDEFDKLSAAVPPSCTWTPLAKLSPRAITAKTTAVAQGFFGRMVTLATRIVHGAD